MTSTPAVLGSVERVVIDEPHAWNACHGFAAADLLAIDPTYGGNTMPAPTVSQPGFAGFDDFFIQTRKWVVGAVTLTTRNGANAEDAAQEAFVRASRKWNRVSKLERPDLWVLRVANNIAIDSWRKQRREQVLTEQISSEAARVVDEAWVSWGLENLTPKQRSVVILHYAHGHPVAEVATKLNVSETAVASQLARARHRLRWLFTSGSER